MCLLLTDLACVQSLTSRALGADLHPAARFGQGVFIAHPLGAPSLVSGCQLDRVFNCWLANCLWIINLIKDEHAWVCLAKPSVLHMCAVIPGHDLEHRHDMYAGIVVGEAARVGDHVTIMQHVTLGGTGNERGDRHPKIGNHVQIGVKATILGGMPSPY